MSEFWIPEENDTLGDLAFVDYAELIPALQKDLQLNPATDLLGGVVISASGKPVMFDSGSTGTIAAGASLTISHRLGQLPKNVQVTNYWADNTASAFYTVYNITETSFDVINKGSTNGAIYWTVSA